MSVRFYMAIRRLELSSKGGLMLKTTNVLIDGIRTPILQGGVTDTDEAVIFIHGNPGSSEDWRDLAARASEFSRVLAPDMPGFGRADKPESFSYTVDGYAHHLSELIKILEVRRVHLVLHDFGGLWGIAWAAAHPDALASLTMINVGVLPNYEWHYLARIWRTPIIGEIFMAMTTRGLFRLSLKHGNPRGLPAAFVDDMYDHYDSGTRRAVLRLYRATDDPGAMSEQYAAALGSFLRPTLVLWGASDPYVPVRFANRQREYAPHAEVTILTDSGHWPHADNPDRVAAFVIPFLKKHVTGASHL